MDAVILISGDICEVTFISDGNLLASSYENYVVLAIIKCVIEFFFVNENK